MGVGSRSVLLGYNASAAYVEAVLEAEGYAPVRHYFDVPVWSEHTGPSDVVYVCARVCVWGGGSCSRRRWSWRSILRASLPLS